MIIYDISFRDFFDAYIHRKLYLKKESIIIRSVCWQIGLLYCRVIFIYNTFEYIQMTTFFEEILTHFSVILTEESLTLTLIK